MFGRINWLRDLLGFIHVLEVSLILFLIVWLNSFWDVILCEEAIIVLGIIHMSIMWATLRLDPYLNIFYRVIIIVCIGFGIILIVFQML